MVVVFEAHFYLTASGDGTWQEAPNEHITSKTFLAPFRKDNNRYWNSDDARLRDGLANLHYTYPPVKLSYTPPYSPISTEVTIDITQPPSKDHRLLCIAAFQGYYSSVSVRELKPGADVFSAHATLQPSIFASQVALPEPSTLALTPGKRLELTHTPSGHRVFNVHTSLHQFAFRGSHRLELYVHGELVDELSVFSRILPENCANCTARISSDNARVHATLTIPQQAVEGVLERAGLNTPNASKKDVIAAIARSIHARIITPDGTLLAEAKPATDAEEAEEEKLSEDKMPSLELRSARVLVPRDETLAQWFADDWEPHGELLTSNWIHA